MTLKDKIQKLETSEDIKLAIKKTQASSHEDKYLILSMLFGRLHEINDVDSFYVEPADKKTLEKKAVKDFITDNPFVSGQEIENGGREGIRTPVSKGL